ncbi:MAG: AMP-binding protein [Bacteroidales bacterium]|jgi:long-chain acyl-CoA synthetase|nr:AMP-binding protein [Bacteroidales bacterium]MDD2203994.1 AMP-binding protein [Bacteroidales bacterium]MDD3151392.1 AMP-binding protein [Bacteroidales bacterium]MDD3913417.1 AMP-binding protein [Bacteroidales bacterium]MDD4633213.1 AMP-binding protein [Bacteroidales bacterium]
MEKQPMNHLFYYIQKSMRNYWDSPALVNYGEDFLTYGQLAEKIARLHIVFEEVGVKKGDKIVLCAKNNVNWGVTFLAITTYQAIAVPLLNDFTAESIQALTEHSEAILLFTEKEKWDRLDHEKFTYLRGAVSADDFAVLYSKEGKLPAAMLHLNEVFKNKYHDEFNIKHVNYPTNNFEDVAIINYTSGTTSAPKGVMLSYNTLSSNVEFGLQGIPNHHGDAIVSMLPLAHMYGLAFEFLYQLAGGTTVHFLGKVPSPKVLLMAMAKVRPYLVITVPLVLEKIFKNNVFPIIKKPSMKFLMKNPITGPFVKKRIRSKVMDVFGGQTRSIVVGGAAINQEVESVMKDIKIPYTVGYGMTECGPLLGYEDWSRFKKGSCGKVVHRMEIRIDSEDQAKIPGEIQVKGMNVMLGYYKNEEATKAAFTEDGWMRTGDMGVIDAAGNIFIRGRIKNMILGSGGQNIYPEEIEDKLNNQPYIIESVVIERDKKIVALVYPDYDRVSQEDLDKMKLAQLMEENRINLNLLLPNYSKIAKIEMLKESFEKTPKRSIKRFLYK